MCDQLRDQLRNKTCNPNQKANAMAPLLTDSALALSVGRRFHDLRSNWTPLNSLVRNLTKYAGYRNDVIRSAVFDSVQAGEFVNRLHNLEAVLSSAALYPGNCDNLLPVPSLADELAASLLGGEATTMTLSVENRG